MNVFSLPFTADEKHNIHGLFNKKDKERKR